MSWLGHLLNVSDKQQMVKREAVTVKYEPVDAINAGTREITQAKGYEGTDP